MNLSDVSPANLAMKGLPGPSQRDRIYRLRTWNDMTLPQWIPALSSRSVMVAVAQLSGWYPPILLGSFRSDKR